MTTRAQAFRFPEHLREVRLRVPSNAETEQESLLIQREEAAYHRGRRDGERALADQLLQQRADLQAIEQGVVQSLTRSIPKVVHNCETGLTDLTLELARKLIGSLPISVEMVEAVVKEALFDLERNSAYRISLHAEDLALLERTQSSLLTQKSPALQFQASAEVTPGGCLIQTPFGTIDARRETKIDSLRRSLVS